MKKTIALFTFFLSLTFNGIACLNGDSKILKNGSFLYEDSKVKIPYGHSFFFFSDNYKSTFREIDSLYKATKDIDYLSDRGLLLILLKEYDKAIKLYLEIEKMKPGRYSTASNIGTAYELIGDNENALKWIKKSVEIDPKSHYESEWIHVKILEAKIDSQKPISSLSFINTDFGTDSLPKTNLSKEALTNLRDALYYQLNERISFIKPKEKIIAQLLFDLADITFLSSDYHDAISIYDMAKEYGFDSTKVEMRKVAISRDNRKKWAEKFEAIEMKYPNNNKLYILIGIVLISLSVITVIIIRRRKKQKI